MVITSEPAWKRAMAMPPDALDSSVMPDEDADQDQGTQGSCAIALAFFSPVFPAQVGAAPGLILFLCRRARS